MISFYFLKFDDNNQASSEAVKDCVASFLDTNQFGEVCLRERPRLANFGRLSSCFFALFAIC